MSEITPLFDRLLVREAKDTGSSAGGLFLPESMNKTRYGDNVRSGTVRRVGTGRVLPSGETAPLVVQEGDLVLYSKHAGNKIRLGGSETEEEFLVLREDEILGVLTQD